MCSPPLLWVPNHASSPKDLKHQAINIVSKINNSTTTIRRIENLCIVTITLRYLMLLKREGTSPSKAPQLRTILCRRKITSSFSKISMWVGISNRVIWHLLKLLRNQLLTQISLRKNKSKLWTHSPVTIGVIHPSPPILRLLQLVMVNTGRRIEPDSLFLRLDCFNSNQVMRRIIRLVNKWITPRTSTIST